jgi:hypothetical protein
MHADGGALASLVSTKASTHARISAFAGMSASQQVRDCRTERLHAFGRDYISRARVGTAFRQHLQLPDCGADRIGADHNADETRACLIAADGNT